MKKTKIFIGCATAIVAVVAAVNVTLSNAKTSMLTDLQLANVEALAQGEENANNTYVWIVTIFSSTNWKCDRGGQVCCPGWNGEC